MRREVGHFMRVALGRRIFSNSARLCSSKGTQKKISSLFMDQPLKQAPEKSSVPAKPFDISTDANAQDSLLSEATSSTSIQSQPLMDLFPIDDAFGLTAAENKQALEAERVPGTPIIPAGKRRFRFDVQYDGSKYYGWQSRAIKAALPAVQDAVEDALCTACDVENLHVVASTLTETGTHARNMTCHVDIDETVDLPSQRLLLQRCEKFFASREDSIAILSFMAAMPGFHARFCAQRRTYVYRILNRIAPPLLDGKGLQWHVDRALNTEKMAEAAEILQGTHDFSGFAEHSISRQLELKGELYTVRHLENIHVKRQADEVLVWCLGRSFLRHQIRNIVSCLHMVGIGQWTTDDVRFVLDRKFVKGRKRERIRPPAAPTHGLTLWEVEYDQSLHPRPEEYVQDL